MLKNQSYHVLAESSGFCGDRCILFYKVLKGTQHGRYQGVMVLDMEGAK